MRPLALAAALALPLPAAAQSWCAGTSLNPTERAICSDPVLGNLDAEMSDLWASAARGGAERGDQNAWRTEVRDACGYDVFCIEEAYHGRIDVLTGYDSQFGEMRLPWCSAGTLNEAERAICSDDRLADLDAAMAAVYGAARASEEDWQQQDWIAERNACGADQACLGAAYLTRIVELGGRLRQR